MIFNVKELTNILNNIAAFTAKDKQIPGVMIDNTGDVVKICYSDGRKHLIRETNAIKEETDPEGKFVVEFEPFIKIVGHCQPFGNILIDDAVLTFEEKVIQFSVDSKIIVGETEDGEKEYAIASNKTMPLPYKQAGADMKSAILIRANYDAIFDSDGSDTWDITELIGYMNRLTVEDGKVAYISAPWKLGFVNNQAYVTAVPIEKEFNHNIQLPTVTAKAVATIIGKIKNELDVDDICVKNIDNNYITFFTADNKFGLWVEAAKGNKIHVENVRRYQSLVVVHKDENGNEQEIPYGKYHVSIRRDLLQDAIKTGLNFASSDKISLKFSRNEDNELYLAVKVSNSGASTGNENRITVSDYCEIKSDEINAKDITSDEFPVSLKVMNDMLNIIKTEIVAFDINIDENGTKTLRLAELDTEKIPVENKLAREAIGLPEVTDEYLASGNAIATPIDVKMGYRAKTLGLIQYTLMQKA